MKIFWGLFILVCFDSNILYGQSNENIFVPALKESKKIDALMDMVLKEEKLSGPENKNLLADNCWRMEIRKIDGNYISFQVVKNRKPIINYILNGLDADRIDYGYFNYRGSKVFVLTSAGFHDFFAKPSGSTTLSFIYKLGTDTRRPPDGLLYERVFHYKYSDGHFSIEGQPSSRNYVSTKFKHIT
jgi:hypothetical protein